MSPSRKRYRFSDAREIAELVEKYGWDVCYTQVQPGDFEVDSWENLIGDCVLYRERFGCRLVVHGTSSPDDFDVMLVERGVAKFFGEAISPRVVALFPPASDVDAVAIPGLETLHVQLPKHRVVAAAKSLGVELLPPSRMHFVEPGVDRLRRVHGDVQRATEILDGGNLTEWKAVEEDLVVTLVALFDRSLHRNRVHTGPIDNPKSYSIAVRDHIHSVHLDEVDIATVADGLGIGRHHLNRCFKEHYGISIQEFIHYRRLHTARDMLSQPQDDLTVTEAAYTSGFHHLGRFSTEYRQLFGETPRQTLQRAVKED